MKANHSIELESFYYLDHFLLLLESVVHQYGELLTSTEKALIKTFKSLSTDAQALLVRLISRKGPLFRSDRLNYPELPKTKPLLAELTDSGLIRCNPTLPITDLLTLATSPELKEWWRQTLSKSLAMRATSARKSDLIEALSTLDCSTYYAKVPYLVVSLEQREMVDLLLLLFFGHPDQDLSAFVSTSLGHVYYEGYSLHSRDRLFRHREDIDTAYQLMKLRAAFYDLDEFTPAAGQALLSLLPRLAQDSPLKARHDRLCNRLGRAFERCGEPTLAMACYLRSNQPPCRERRARIHFKLAEYAKACELCEAMLAQPNNQVEIQFAQQFLPRCQRKTGTPVDPVKPFQPHTEVLLLPRRDQDHQTIANPCRIEHWVCDELNSHQRGRCFFVENWLFKAVFGLTFWQTIFSPVRGAFTHPFQSGPHDLYEAGFRQLRKRAIVSALEDVERDDWSSELLQRWQLKCGTSNPFVSWHPTGWPVIALAVERISRPDWLTIFKRMLTDLRENCCGFPDLIFFPNHGGYRLLEVKSPNDKLQANQKRWMQTFDSAHIPYAVFQVQWQH